MCFSKEANICSAAQATVAFWVIILSDRGGTSAFAVPLLKTLDEYSSRAAVL